MLFHYVLSGHNLNLDFKCQVTMDQAQILYLDLDRFLES